MPGIVGLISSQPAVECQRLVKAMVASMSHEAFYVSDTYSAPEMGVYGGLVAIADSPELSRVAVNEREDLALMLAGECWIDDEIVAAIPQNGNRVSGSAHWLLNRYEKHGDKFFEKLNGNFSALLIDKRKKESFLFNDRFGMERVYIHEASEGTYFASEAKALLRILPQTRAFDPAGVTQFLAFGCTLEWRTLFRSVQQLPGGSVWSFGQGKPRKRNYFSPESWEGLPTLAIDDFENEFQRVFKRILPRYLQHDSRLGIALTGGLDTRMIMACLPDLSPPAICYTFTGEGGETKDDKVAAEVAKACRLEHRLLRLKPEFFSNFASHLDRTVYATDGCSGLAGSHEIYFNRMGHEISTVRLTGVFGSEVFRGMSTFQPVGLTPTMLAPELRQSVQSCERQPPGGNCHGSTFAAFREAPWHLVGNLSASRSQVCFRTPYLDNQLVALAYQMPPSLRASPRTALRLVQNNHTVLRSIPTDRQVGGQTGPLRNRVDRFFCQVLFKIDYYYNEGMPNTLARLDPALEAANSIVPLFGHHKFLHYRIWLRKRLAPFLQQALSDPEIQHQGFWNPAFLSRMAADHIRGRRNYVKEIDAVLTLNAVKRLLLKG
jgi:asparagine synthase (glutamine-hydrolysing)